MKRTALVIAVAGLLAIGLACSNKKAESNVSGTTAPSPSGSARAATDTATPRGLSDTATPVPLQTGTVLVTAGDNFFTPSQLRVAAGQTTFKVKNEGKGEHEFEIFKDGKLVDEVEDIAPGMTRELKVNLSAGEYVYVCKLPGHEEAGQKGVLTVV